MMSTTSLLSSLRSRVALPVLRRMQTVQRKAIPVVRYRHQDLAFQELNAKLAETHTRKFQNRLKAEVGQAQRFIADQYKTDKNGFVVLDIDETVLDHRGFYEGPFVKLPKTDFYTKWDEWIQAKKAPALAATKPLIDWLNRFKIPYVFVTGRIEAQREVTLQNLKQAHVIGDSFQGLFCKPNTWWEQSTAEHKKRVVAELEKATRQKAIASIGDREADMMLTDASRNFKLSSSMYYPSRDASGLQ